MSLQKNIPEVNKKIDDLIKEDFGSLTSTLANRLGPEAVSRVDSIVEQSYERARSEWSSGTLPRDPRGLIWQFVTDNTTELFCAKIHHHSNPMDDKVGAFINLEYPDKEEVRKNKIVMLFACSFPSNNISVNAALILKILGGYTSSDIARILSRNESTVLNEIETAKKQIIEKKIPFTIPGKYVLRERTVSLLNLLEYIFKLGYRNPDERIKFSREICNSALNLCELLTKYGETNFPESRALMAYMLLCSSRFDSMVDKKGNILKLRQQDRTKWDKDFIKKGIEYLYSSASGSNVDKMHLMAGIEAVHSTSPDYKSTNWKQIISLFKSYLAVNNSPETELEMAIAISKSEGPEDGLAAIKNIKKIKTLENNALLSLTLGDLYLQLHEYEAALSNFGKARDLTESSVKKNYINSKIHICRQRIKMTKRYKHSLSF